MTTRAIALAIVAAILAVMIPMSAKAETKPTVFVFPKMPPAYYYSAPTSTPVPQTLTAAAVTPFVSATHPIAPTMPVMTRKQKDARIVELLAQIRAAQSEIDQLSK